MVKMSSVQGGNNWQYTRVGGGGALSSPVLFAVDRAPNMVPAGWNGIQIGVFASHSEE